MITRYAPRNRQNDPQRNNPNPNPHDFRNHRLLLVLRDSEIPSNHTQSPGFNDRAIYGRHPNGFVRRILSTLAGAGNSRRTPVKRPTIAVVNLSRRSGDVRFRLRPAGPFWQCPLYPDSRSPRRLMRKRRLPDWPRPLIPIGRGFSLKGRQFSIFATSSPVVTLRCAASPAPYLAPTLRELVRFRAP
jgi:hypothetical protein